MYCTECRVFPRVTSSREDRGPSGSQCPPTRNFAKCFVIMGWHVDIEVPGCSLVIRTSREPRALRSQTSFRSQTARVPFDGAPKRPEKDQEDERKRRQAAKRPMPKLPLGRERRLESITEFANHHAEPIRSPFGAHSAHSEA